MCSSSTCRRPYNPARASTPAVWALPLSLAATRGVTNCFPFLRLLRCFSSSGWPPIKVDRPPAGRVSPFGHPRIKGRSRLPAAFRSLPRPSSPPGAKASPVRLTVLVAYRACPAALAAAGSEYPRSLFLSLIVFSFVFPSILSKNLVLGLSFTSDRVESKGFEPLTPGLQSRCSGQLS